MRSLVLLSRRPVASITIRVVPWEIGRHPVERLAAMQAQVEPHFLFNTLAVVGIAGAISPMAVGPDVLTRDILVMAALTLSLFIFGMGHSDRPGRINRFEAAGLLACYFAYSGYLVTTVFMQ